MTTALAIYILSQTSVCIFAVTGVLASGKREMDITSIVLVGMVTALGGGTLRDMMLGSMPLFWIRDMHYFWSALGASVTTFFIVRFVRLPFRFFLYADAAGVALFCVLVAEKMLAQLHLHPVVAAIMGVVTGVAGGMLRDTMLGDTPLLLKKDLYIAPALVGTALYVTLKVFCPIHPYDLLAGMAAIFLLRAAAIHYHLSYPKWLLYQHR